jgi:hypothetical protein
MWLGSLKAIQLGAVPGSVWLVVKVMLEPSNSAMRMLLGSPMRSLVMEVVLVLQSRGEMPVGRAAAMAIPAMPATSCFHCMMVLLRGYSFYQMGMKLMSKRKGFLGRCLFSIGREEWRIV